MQKPDKKVLLKNVKKNIKCLSCQQNKNIKFDDGYQLPIL